MDIGLYCLATAVALWGEPHKVHATASLLESGVDAHGLVVLDYGDFSVTLQHSKVSDSVLPSEIQGENGSLVIEKISECQKLSFVPRGGKAQELTQPQHINTMLYEAEVFARLVEDNEVNHPGLAVSRTTAKLQTEIRPRRPADAQPPGGAGAAAGLWPLDRTTHAPLQQNAGARYGTGCYFRHRDRYQSPEC
jgi:predicted dehydrogenase